jgi:hypothetical protein
VSPILIEQAVPYVLGNSSVFKKGAPEQVDVHGGTWEGFWSMIAGEDHQRRNPEPHHPSVSLQKDFGENERNKGNRHRFELALLGFDCQAANRPHSTYDQPVVL